MKLQCQLNNHGLTGHLEGTQDNRGQEGCLIFPPPVGSAVSLETAKRASIVGCRTKTFVEITLSLMDLGFDFGSLAMGFCVPDLYHVMGKMMILKLRLGGGQ